MFPLSDRAAVSVFRAVAVFGLVAAMVGGVAAWGLLGQAEAALADSLSLTADTLEALDGSAAVATTSVAALTAGLAQLEATSLSLDAAFDDGELLLVELADLLRNDVAASIGAVDDALPGLTRVAGTIDSTLSALSVLPFGPAYDPQESFADALRELDSSLTGVPERLVDQADLVDATAGSLGDVGQGISSLVEELSGFDAALTDTSLLLADYETTITEGASLIREASDRLNGQILAGRVAVVLIALAFASLQVVPLHLAGVAAGRSRVPGDGPARVTGVA